MTESQFLALEPREQDALPRMVERQCQRCGKGFTARRYQVRRGQCKYCSTTCAQLASRKHPVREHWGVRYYLNVEGYFIACNGSLLHRVIWEEAFGPIPPNHDIHHVDDDRHNNDIANLESMTHSEHSRHHGLKQRKLPVQPKTWCQAEGCDRQARARGLCAKHYQRIRAEERGHWPRSSLRERSNEP